MRDCYRMSEPSVTHAENSSTSDLEVIQDVRNGKVGAFEILIRAYQRYVFKIVNRHVPMADVQEVAHQSFITAYRSLHSFKGKTEFRFWLATIAIRTCHDYWRKRYNRVEVSESQLSETARNSINEFWNSEAENCFDLRERREDLREHLDWALGRLSPDDRMVVSLVHLEDRSIAYAARHLGLSKANVKIRAFRARRKLRKLMEESLKPTVESHGRI